MEIIETIVGIFVLLIVAFIFLTLFQKAQELESSHKFRKLERERDRKNEISKKVSALHDELKSRSLLSFTLPTDPTPTDAPEEPPEGVLVGIDTDTNQPIAMSEQLRGRHRN